MTQSAGPLGSICCRCMYYDRLTVLLHDRGRDFIGMQNYSIDACIVANSFKSQLFINKQSSLTLFALYFEPKLRDRAMCNSFLAKRLINISHISFSASGFS